MKTIILAGGLGTRISEESHLKPKPMIEVGDYPMIWHIMKIYSHFGFNEFVICAGYKQHVIKEYFADYYLRTNDVTFDFTNGGGYTTLANASECWKVTVVDTGRETMTGGRLKRVQSFIGEETFMLTYGDGVADIDLRKVLDFHKSHGRIATLTSVNVTQRYGVLDYTAEGVITSFREKKDDDKGTINGGFMVFEPQVFSLIKGDDSVLELNLLEDLANNGELMAYHHNGFWQSMDTMKDRAFLEDLWKRGAAPWKLW
jgi:glucose-1-phosphate cytidylyltransferase